MSEEVRVPVAAGPLRTTAFCEPEIPKLSKPFRFKALPPKSIKIE
ncbi:MAG: hypothetical protein AB7S41_05205 [Parvibaculaceae bacterium]